MWEIPRFLPVPVRHRHSLPISRMQEASGETALAHELRE
jgi:hypothetical protein